MIRRIPQRTIDDCVICTVAMVMGSPYHYERVLAESTAFPRLNADGKHFEWWRAYLTREGFDTCYRPWSDLYQLYRYGGQVVGIVNLQSHEIRQGHAVAVDELGIVDPCDGSPDHQDIGQYVLDRRAAGFEFISEFMAVRGHGYATAGCRGHERGPSR